MAEAFVSGTPSTWVPAETCRPSDGKAKRSASLTAMPCGYHQLASSWALGFFQDLKNLAMAN
jgi:hypothetical protein